jgi:hypothetical protein
MMDIFGGSWFNELPLNVAQPSGNYVGSMALGDSGANVGFHEFAVPLLFEAETFNVADLPDIGVDVAGDQPTSLFEMFDSSGLEEGESGEQLELALERQRRVLAYAQDMATKERMG